MQGSESIPSFVVERPISRRALALARTGHAGQRRAGDGAPFVEHPIAVARMLAEVGADDEVVAAGLAHDLLEKSDLTLDLIARRLGKRVAGIVAAVTEDPTIPRPAARKDALSVQVAGAGRDAAMVYAADKVEKVRELRARVAAEGPQALLLEEARRKLRHYTTAFSVVENMLHGHPIVERLRAQLSALRAIPEAELAAALPAAREPS
jgi:(p)ppGpp synthase/HD superfamily hydrolase